MNFSPLSLAFDCLKLLMEFYYYYYYYFWLRWVFVTACRLFSSCGELGLLFVEVCGLLIAVASLVAESGL